MCGDVVKSICFLCDFSRDEAHDYYLCLTTAIICPIYEVLVIEPLDKTLSAHDEARDVLALESSDFLFLQS